MDSIKNSVLLTVDRCTGVATVVGPQESQFQELAALAFGPDETLYGLNHSLFEIDTLTGLTEPIGGWFGLRIGAADFDPLTGTLYGIELDLNPPQKLVAIDLTSGQATVVAELSVDIGVVGTMMFTEAGTIIGSGYTLTRGTILFEMDITGNNIGTGK